MTLPDSRPRLGKQNKRKRTPSQMDTEIKSATHLLAIPRCDAAGTDGGGTLTGRGKPPKRSQDNNIRVWHGGGGGPKGTVHSL